MTVALPNPTNATAMDAWEKKITLCRRCPRLTTYIDAIKLKYPDYWCRPVPAFGDPNARILLLGLAPGRAGSNRTGRMFTGDASGNFMFPILHQVGLASQPGGSSADDGLVLHDTFITAVARCAPPQNKPTPEELRNCIGYFAKELELLKHLRVVVALGKIAHDGYLTLLGATKSKHPFKHGAVYRFDGHPTLLDTYHPSRQNTNTGVLTGKMFLKIFRTAQQLAEEKK